MMISNIKKFKGNFHFTTLTFIEFQPSIHPIFFRLSRIHNVYFRITFIPSGYHLIHAWKNVSLSDGGHSSHNVNPLVWKELWKYPVKDQSILRALATRLNLCKRKVNVNPMCPLCEDQVESEEHLFFLCPWVQMVWFCSNFNYRVNPQSFTTFDQWFESLIQMKFPFSLAKRKFLTNISFLLWYIWKARCQFIFEGCKPELIRILKLANSAAGDFLEVYLLVKT